MRPDMSDDIWEAPAPLEWVRALLIPVTEGREGHECGRFKYQGGSSLLRMGKRCENTNLWLASLGPVDRYEDPF